MKQWLRLTKLLTVAMISLASCRNDLPDSSRDTPEAPEDVQQERITISNMTKADIPQVHKLTAQGYRLQQHNPDSAIQCYLDALSLALRMGYTEGAALSYTNLATAYIRKNNYGQADYYRSQFKKQLEKIPSRYFNPKSSRHQWLTQYRDFNRAVDRYTTGEVDTATVLYLALLSELGQDNPQNYKLMAWSYAGLGAISYKFGDSSRSSQYFEQMRLLGEKYADSAIWIQALTNQATFLENSRRHKQALPYAQQALALAETTNDLRLASGNMHLIAHALIGMGRADSALNLSKKRLQVSQDIGDKDGIREAYKLLGHNYNELGQFKLAEAALKKAYGLAMASRYFIQIYSMYFQLAKAYEGQGKYAQALEYFKRFADCRDSLQSTENAKNIAETESRYQVAEKDKKLALQELRIARQQKNLYLWIGGGVCCVALLGGLLRRKQQKTTIEKLQARLAGEEQERARMARELHDGIVSRLSVIKTSFSALPQYYRGDPEAGALQDAVRQLDQSIVELRSTSHNLMPEVLKRDGLVESVRSYCEKVSQIDSLMVRFQLVGSLPLLSDAFQLNVYRIIQELLQNILKHSQATRALVQFNVQEDQLDITVEDNGPQQATQSSGKPAGQTLDTQGIGWMNLKDRVKLLEGQLELEQNGVTAIYLTFSLKKHQV